MGLTLLGKAEAKIGILQLEITGYCAIKVMIVPFFFFFLVILQFFLTVCPNPFSCNFHAFGVALPFKVTQSK